MRKISFLGLMSLIIVTFGAQSAARSTAGQEQSTVAKESVQVTNVNLSGFNFWLAKLNQFGGDFRRAEMVKAFLVSTEYRARFGQP